MSTYSLFHSAPILHPRGWTLRFAAVAVMLTLSLLSVTAQNLQLVLSVDKTQADIGSSEMFEFRIQYNCASTITDAFSAQLTDTLPASVNVVGIVDSPHVASSNLVGNTVTFDFIDPLPAGATGDLILQCRFFPDDTQ